MEVILQLEFAIYTFDESVYILFASNFINQILTKFFKESKGLQEQHCNMHEEVFIKLNIELLVLPYDEFFCFAG